MVACFTDFLKSGLIVQKHTSSVSKFLMFYGVGKKIFTFYGGVFYRVFEIRTHCPRTHVTCIEVSYVLRCW